MSRRITPLLLALNAALAIVLVLLWFGPGANARKRWVAPDALPPNLNAITANLLGINPALNNADGALLERPLFAQDRRPPAPPKPAAAPPAPPPPDLLDKIQLRGIVRGNALSGVLAEVDGKPRLIRRGDALGDWRLQGVREREVTFGKGAEQRVIKLPMSMASAPAAADPTKPRPNPPLPPPGAPAAVEKGK